ncbi:MAG TPA: apolipoprotein N-acyltransferase [Smithellaceae bacterium]|nr:apolipoprotein N-acyltransferase [Smithellaceae bacterium]HRV43835.1 apolipoprotein N-acyltransferase [Smithellaceae bacterium]
MKINEKIINRNEPGGMPQSSSLFFALLCGLLYFLSFPKFGVGIIAWIALVPLLIALNHVSSLSKALVLGWVAGITAHVGLLYWIAHVVVTYGYLPFYLGVILTLLLAGYLSVYFALFAAGMVYFRGRVPLVLAAPVLWVCLEYLKSCLFTGFPWENLGYSQFSNIWFIQVADITGVHGLSFLIVLLNITLFNLLTQRSKKAIALAMAVFLLWSGVYAYGAMRIRQIRNSVNLAEGMDVSLIQGNIDQSVKWNENFQAETIRIYEELSLRGTKVPGGLVVWPETAVPFNFQEPGDLQGRVRRLPSRTKSWLLFGSVSYAGDRAETRYYNSAYLLSPGGDRQEKYDKVHLVPYGEYVPLRKLFPFVGSLASGIGDFTSGKGYTPLSMDGRKIGVMICYEGILPEAARRYKNAGADLLVNITNDAWFGRTSAPYQHLSMSVFRAVETRLCLVRAANTGISAMVDPTGRILARTGLFERNQIAGRMPLIQTPTVYAAWGDWLVWVCFAGLAASGAWRLTRRGKNVRR